MNPAERPILPDTNVLVHVLRNDEIGQRIEDEHGLSSCRTRPLLSTIVEAEVKALAQRKGWGEKRMAALAKLLGELVPVGIRHRSVVDAYVHLYCRAHDEGKYRQFRQNDLWIAATAMAAGATLYTCNAKDFDWIDPSDADIVFVET